MKIPELARLVTQLEGGAVNLPIAQVMETMRVLADVQARHPEGEQAWRQYVQTKRDIIQLRDAEKRLDEMEAEEPPLTAESSDS